MTILPVCDHISGFQNSRSYNSCLRQYCCYFFILRLCYPTQTTVRSSALQSLPLGPSNCVWPPLSFPFSLGQFTGSVEYYMSQLPDIPQLQKRALVQILFQCYIAISCWLSACSSLPCSSPRWASYIPISERRNLLVLFGFQTIYTETSLQKWKEAKVTLTAPC